jgi:radical SAM superfamily enzyme YgiQ (UPF0313 family)
MRVLLVKPINKIYYVISPNLGLGYLATALREAGFQVDMLDSGKEGLTYAGFEKLLRQNHYDVVGLQMFSHEVESVRKHLSITKRVDRDIHTILGGPHPSGAPQETLTEINDADFGFVGEAETGLPQLMELLADGETTENTLREVPGLVWRNNQAIVVNPARRQQQLDSIGFPAWDLMNPRDYPTAPHGTFSKRSPVAPIIVTRGCPYSCGFCGGFNITGKEIRSRSVDDVIREIEFLIKEYGVKEIHIEDDNFTFNQDLVRTFCSELIAKNIDISWSCPNGVRIDKLDPELVQLMEKAGCHSLALGIESGSDQILRKMNKYLTTETIKKKVDMIKDTSSISLTGFFLIGYPEEEEVDIEKSISFAKNLRIDKVSFMYTMPLPGTPLYQEWIDKAGTENIDWDNFFYYRIVPNLSGIPAKRLQALQRKALLTFYLRPRIIVNLLKELRTFQQYKAMFWRVREIFFKKAVR